ncbi:hypothetical protein DOY81_003058 [Sarcophaga bullata]|nr:hypothetical protein DOY81_003058 [Sarcophaga bullata]
MKMILLSTIVQYFVASHQDTFGSDVLKNRGHRRSDTLGKSMPITSLLLNYTPSSLQISNNIRSDAGTGNISPTLQELPPLYFPVHDTLPNQSVEPVENSVEQQTQNNLDTDDDLDDVEQEYEILVSECSSSNGDSDREGKRRKSNSEEYISLIGNSKFYAPCLTCVGSAPSDLAARPSAINEMCRRLCTEECRLRLSLAGLVTPSERILNNRLLLEQYVKDSLEKSNSDTPPKLPPRPVRKLEEKEKTYPRPPGNIAIQRKKFLTNMLTENGNLSSDDEEDLDKQQPPKELLDVVNSIVARPLKALSSQPLPIPQPSSSSLPPKTTTSSSASQNSEVIDDVHTNVQIDPHELEMLKDFREKFEIAEALAKTSAMTSTSKIKQRLAARKLEIELENAKKTTNINANTDSIAAYPRQHRGETLKYKNDNSNNNNENVSHTGLASTNDDIIGNATASDKQGVPDAVTTQQNLSHNIADTASPFYDYDYEPPRELLLYLVRTIKY